ncbi:MAG: DUF2721 domain-containing protein [Leptolyngbyaceae cyanobacterium]
MTVEQTTQLIQLILNAVLLTMACALMYSRVSVLHGAIGDRRQEISHQFTDLLGATVDLRHERLTSLKKQMRYLQQRHRLTHYSLLAVNYALFFAVISTFTLALRSLINLEILIPLALALFVVGIVGLLAGVGLILIDLHSADRALWPEAASFLSTNWLEDRVRPNPKVTSLPAPLRSGREVASRRHPTDRDRVKRA